MSFPPNRADRVPGPQGLDAIESAETLLDVYEQDIIDLPGAGSYRDDKGLAASRISSMIGDLAAYAEHHRIDFYPASHARLGNSRPSRRYSEPVQSEDSWHVGAEVQVARWAQTSGKPTTPGYVSELHPGDAPECTVVFPGVPERRSRIQADHLRSADPFPIVATTRGPISSAASAEAAFVEAAANIRLANARRGTPTPRDLVNHACLAAGLAQWAGINAGRIEAVLAPEIEDAVRALTAPRESVVPAPLAANDVVPQTSITPPSAGPRRTAPSSRPGRTR
ncbi:hypothetical protein [Actinomadura rupiterrae]|uniref:hypothetical protein n=1 Tax=Actinomadura rupiterrae TaxID=559627 RepID=UPI0020A4D3CE|nr:hypothetical protein [Actinomadura rupiterrae]MCP2337927.1 hypothetical protein [Actinomadura rupiterrae]